MRRPRLVVDTNVWVSALLNKEGAPSHILRLYIAGEVEIITCVALLEELRDVLTRPIFAQEYGITQQDVETYIELIHQEATIVTPVGESFGCKDPDDDIVIETAIIGNADVIVSGDAHLTQDETLSNLLRSHNISVLEPRRLVEAIT